MVENWSIYRHTFPDGKVYIGKTKESPEERWGLYGRNYQNQRKVFNAILAFGWNNIKHEVLYSNLTAEEASAKEQELIMASDSVGATGNYNVQYAKTESSSKKRVNGDDDVICTESLRKNGRCLAGLPDAYYDRALLKHGITPFGITLDEEKVTFEIWRSTDGGYEYAENTKRYPREHMTFREVREWLVETGEIGEEDKKSYFSDETIEREIESLRSATNNH